MLTASVGQREREIALRVALGATPGNVRSLVLREIAWLSGTGAVLGLVVAVLATRLLRTMLYGVDPLDTTTLAAAAIVVAGASVLVSWWPLRRATRIDALAVLRA